MGGVFFLTNYNMKIYRLREAKTSQLRKLLNNGNITEEQFNIADEFFKKYSAFEKEIDWNRGLKITWDDLKSVIYKERNSESQTKKKIRKGLEGFEEGKDYVVLEETDDYVAYQPFTWEASRMIASHYVEPSRNEYGEIEDAEWCTAYQKTRDYWDIHSNIEAFIYICGETIPSKKVAISVSKEVEDASGSEFSYYLYKDRHSDLNFNIWDFGDDNYTIKEEELLEVVPDLHTLIVKAYKNWGESRIERLKAKFVLNPETNRYDYDHSLSEVTLKAFVNKDGDGFIINFGEISGSFTCKGLGLTSLKGAPTYVDFNFDCSNNKLTSLKGAPKQVWGAFSCKINELTSLKGAPQAIGRDFDCSRNQLTSLERGPQIIGGSFNCIDNKLTSLKGAPWQVGKHFLCSHNPLLVSLEGAPKTVGWNFDCSKNQLTSLEGAPQTVGGDFKCYDNQLTSLKGAPQTVGGGFNCSYTSLTSLEGSPQKVGRDFYCYNNNLRSLEGAPKEVGEDFFCYNNRLTSLKGAPQEVGRDFICSWNQLTSLEGAPHTVGGYFDCRNNPNLHSLDGIGEVGQYVLSDFEKP